MAVLDCILLRLHAIAAAVEVAAATLVAAIIVAAYLGVPTMEREERSPIEAAG